MFRKRITRKQSISSSVNCHPVRPSFHSCLNARTHERILFAVSFLHSTRARTFVHVKLRKIHTGKNRLELGRSRPIRRTRNRGYLYDHRSYREHIRRLSRLRKSPCSVVVAVFLYVFVFCFVVVVRFCAWVECSRFSNLICEGVGTYLPTPPLRLQGVRKKDCVPKT